jgi:hypothetical protein
MSFWDNVIQDTPAMLLPPPENTPYDNVLGTAVSLDPSINDAGAEAVHPSLSPDAGSPNSLVTKAGQPAGFGDDPADLSPNVFATWHTAYQEEYVNLHKGADGFVTIGAHTGTSIHVTLSSAQDKVFILEALQKADFATMTKADQQRIATADQGFKAAADPTHPYNDVLGRLGLVATEADVDGTTTDANGVETKSLYQQTLDTINSTDPKDAASFVSQDDKNVFLQELANIQTEISKMGVFSPPDINAAVQAISDRFKRVAVFAKSLDPSNAEVAQPTRPIPDPGPQLDPTQFKNVISLDGGAAIARGFQAFMNAEKQILAADNASIQISNTGTLEGLTKHLDAPNLVAAFQLGANLKDQAINAADTEEINQINELLKAYNVMQELINQTIATFDASKTDEKRGLLGYDDHPEVPNNNGPQQKAGDNFHDVIDVLTDPATIDAGKTNQITPPKLTPEQMKVISMFEKDLNGIANPIEDLLGIKRPSDFDFYDNSRPLEVIQGDTLNYFQKSTWDEWSATLGNTVQQISQQNQITFNNINTLEKERTTHFQSATNALTKAVDITSSIGRNIA